MRRFFALVIFAFVSVCMLVAESVRKPIVLTGADMRPAISLNGEWATIVDPYFTGLYSFHQEERTDGYFLNRKALPDDSFPTEYDFSKSSKLKVPGDWNTQRESLYLYEGPVWYEHDFTYSPKKDRRVFLHVGAANYRSWFWVNGTKVCEHEGGYTSFNCEVTGALREGSNFVVAAVDNTRSEDGVPTLQTDWWNYGGLTRSVSLIELPQAFIDQYDLHLSRTGDSVLEGWAHLTDGTPGSTIEVSLPELNAHVTATVGADGKALFHLPVRNLVRWSPENPRLYKVWFTAGADQVNEEIGFRTVEVRGTQILLNGRPIFLRGICIHAEAPYRTGRAYSDQDAATLLGWAQELGANFVRLAHYPHDESMLREADRKGLLVWAENPVYWALLFDQERVYAKARQQLEEEIGTSRNHAAIILWSMANETPNQEARTRFISALAARARELDSTRLITAALLVRAEGQTKIVDDPLGKVLDVIGVNEYIGWYEQHPESADRTRWRVDYQKPMIVSEFGADAKAGLHGGENERWTEEFQANIYRHQLAMLNRIPQLRGVSPWILMDFRAPRRMLPEIQNGFNRKGIISDQGEKKAAFYVLQKAYQGKSIGRAD